jgi:hypothetical protein
MLGGMSLPLTLLLIKSQVQNEGQYKNSGKYALIEGRWKKLHHDQPAPKGAPVAHGDSLKSHGAKPFFVPYDKVAQLKLPDTNTNAPTFNKQISKLFEYASKGDAAAILGMPIGVNTYGKKLALAANWLLQGMGVHKHVVAHGQAAGMHPGVQAPASAAPAEPVKAKPAHPDVTHTFKSKDGGFSVLVGPSKPSGFFVSIKDDSGESLGAVNKYPTEHAALHAAQMISEGKDPKKHEPVAETPAALQAGADYAGWSGSKTGLILNKDPAAGGMIDVAFNTNKWFVVANDDAIGKVGDQFNSQAEALAALQLAVSKKGVPATASVPLAQHVKDTLDTKAAEGQKQFLQDVANNNPDHPQITSYAKKLLVRMEPKAAPLDHGVLNISGKTNGINAALDKYKADKAKTDKTLAQAATTEKKADKAKAKELFAAHGEALADSTVAKNGVNKKDAMDTIDQLVKWQPAKAIALLEKFAADQNAKKPPEVPAAPEAPAAPTTPPDFEPAPHGLNMPVFGGDKPHIKAYYEKVAQKVIDHGLAGNASVLEEMKSSGLVPNAKTGKVSATWKGKSQNSDSLLHLYKKALKYAQGGSKPEPAVAIPSAAAPSTGNLDSIPWDKLTLPDSNVNAKGHNKAIAEIKALAYAGDKAGLQAFIAKKAGKVQTYAKKHFTIATAAHAALDAEAAAPANTPANDTGPKDGDLKEGADGGMLVFKNGRWHAKHDVHPIVAKEIGKMSLTDLQKMTNSPAGDQAIKAAGQKALEKKLIDFPAYDAFALMQKDTAGKPGAMDAAKNLVKNWIKSNPGKQSELNEALSSLGYHELVFSPLTLDDAVKPKFESVTWSNLADKMEALAKNGKTWEVEDLASGLVGLTSDSAKQLLGYGNALIEKLGGQKQGNAAATPPDANPIVMAGAMFQSDDGKFKFKKSNDAESGWVYQYTGVNSSIWMHVENPEVIEKLNAGEMEPIKADAAAGPKKPNVISVYQDAVDGIESALQSGDKLALKEFISEFSSNSTSDAKKVHLYASNALKAVNGEPIAPEERTKSATYDADMKMINQAKASANISDKAYEIAIETINAGGGMEDVIHNMIAGAQIKSANVMEILGKPDTPEPGLPEKPTVPENYRGLFNKIEKSVKDGNKSDLQDLANYLQNKSAPTAKELYEYASACLASMSPPGSAKEFPPKPEVGVLYTEIADGIEKAAKAGNQASLTAFLTELDGTTGLSSTKLQAYASQCLAVLVGSYDGPKDGDTKPGANGGTLVFKDGRWHKQGEMSPVVNALTELYLDGKINKDVYDTGKAAADLHSGDAASVLAELNAYGYADAAGILGEKMSPVGKAAAAVHPLDAMDPPSVSQFKNPAGVLAAVNALKEKAKTEGASAFTGAIKKMASGKTIVTLANPNGSGNYKITGYGSLSDSDHAKLYHYVQAMKEAAGGKKAKAKANPNKPIHAKPAPTGPEIESIDGWKQTGQQEGSNPGGKFVDNNGVAWYCKFPNDPGHAKSEVLATKLYAAAGLSAQQAKFVTKDGKLGIASKWNDVTVGSASQLAKADGVQAGFAVDAWLGNYDVIGPDYKNTQLDSNGNGFRVDAGGSLEYRAQGAKKANFTDKVTELDSMRNPSVNASCAAVFGSMTDADLSASVAKVLSISDLSIRALVNQFGPGDATEKKALIDKLIARKADLAARFPKAVKKKKEIVFKPENLTVPPNFMNWGGSGKGGPSSKEYLNKANDDAVKAIYEAAKSGNVDKIKALQFPVMAKESGEQSGVANVLEHPSKHVSGYAAQAISEINAQLNPPKKFRFDGGHPLATLHDAYPVYKGDAHDGSVTHVAKFISLGDVGKVDLDALGIPDKITHKSGALTQETYAAAAQAAASVMPASQLSAIKGYTGSGYHAMNASMWTGNEAGAAAAATSGLKAHSHDIAPGTILSRKLTVNDAKGLQEILDSTGQILQENRIISTSIRPSAWHGNVHFKLHVGPGVKGLYVGYGSKPGGGAISSNASEDEMILPPKTRLLILSVKTSSHHGDADGFGTDIQHLVEAVILPTE